MPIKVKKLKFTTLSPSQAIAPAPKQANDAK